MPSNLLWQEWLQDQHLWSGNMVRLAGQWAFAHARPGTFTYQVCYRVATLGYWVLLWLPWGGLLLWQRWSIRIRRDGYDELRHRQRTRWLFWILTGGVLSTLVWPAPAPGALPVAWGFLFWLVMGLWI